MSEQFPKTEPPRGRLQGVLPNRAGVDNITPLTECKINCGMEETLDMSEWIALLGFTECFGALYKSVSVML